MYIEKYVEISRPDAYASRGFGFLLNSGIVGIAGNSPISILTKNRDTNELETVESNETYAQIVVVETGIY